MKVWQCDDSRPVAGLVQAEVKTPGPQRGEVLIRVHAGVNRCAIAVPARQLSQ